MLQQAGELPTGERGYQNRPLSRFSWACLPWGNDEPGSAARRGQMTRNLGINAYVVERTRKDRDDDRARVSTGSRRRAVIATLASCDRPDDQPNHYDQPSDSHSYLQEKGSSGYSVELRTRDLPSSTPSAVATRGWRLLYTAHSDARDTRPIFAAGFPHRCILRADGPAGQDRPRARGTREASPSVGFPARRRCSAAPAGPYASRSHVVHVHH